MLIQHAVEDQPGRPSGHIDPVFDPQARYSLEMADVGCENGQAASQGYGGDLKVGLKSRAVFAFERSPEPAVSPGVLSVTVRRAGSVYNFLNKRQSNTNQADESL